ncbi:MAG: SH3 domain-containing protein [Ardenticatenaceae bacterium]|nr:SH3 domain-containing protein [Ardenticatenaceae bacterium]
MGRTAVSFGNTAVSTFKGIFAAPDEFLFAYTGERKLPALPPGFPTPDPQATSIIVISSANNAPQRSLRPTPTTNRAVEIIEDEGELETAVPSNSPSESQPTFPSSVSTPQSAPETDVPTEHATLIVGGYAIVVDTGSQALLARAEAGTEYEIVSRFPEGSRLIVLEGPVTADGFNWWKMRGDDGEGWCADRWLHPVED